jgi:lipopolysaccharide transport system permease protein
MKRIITNKPDTLVEYLNKIWQYRSLIMVFAKRDLKVKYAQTWLGLGWTIVQPLTGLLIFTFFFGYILNWQADGLPYSLYVLSGLLGWNYFTYIVFQGMSSMQESGNIIKKIYFPKALLPLSKVLVALVELSVSFLLLIPLLVWHQQALSWKIIFIPIVLIFNTLIALSVVFITASLSYRVRDLVHLVPFLMYFGIWVTPVFFTKDILPQQISFVWFFNPMAAVVEGWRWCLFSGWQYILYFVPALLSTIFLFFISFFIYKKAESKFSDFS